MKELTFVMYKNDLRRKNISQIDTVKLVQLR